MKVHKLGYFYRCARVLEDCYDSEIPYDLRIKVVGETLRKRNELVSIQKELLVMAAFAHWLLRSHARRHADLVLREYETMSFNISSGKTDDSLGAFKLSQSRRGKRAS